MTHGTALPRGKSYRNAAGRMKAEVPRFPSTLRHAACNGNALSDFVPAPRIDAVESENTREQLQTRSADNGESNRRI